MWGVVARIAAAAAVLTLVQHNISQMYKAYYDERMKEEAGPTKSFPKVDPDDRDGTARGAPRGGRREGGIGGGRSISTATIASAGGAWAAAAATDGSFIGSIIYVYVYPVCSCLAHSWVLRMFADEISISLPMIERELGEHPVPLRMVAPRARAAEKLLFHLQNF